MANGKVKRQQVLFEYLVDQNATQRVNTANQQIESGFERMQKAIQRGGVAGTQELKKLEKESREALQDINALRGGIAKLDKTAATAFDNQVDGIKDFQKQIKLAQNDVRDFDEEFSAASQQVALAGDVESGARTLGGAVGAFGGAGGAQIERGVAVLSEIPASLEAIGKLKPALRGLPDAIKSVATSIGTTGIGLGAVAITAAVAFSLLSKRASEAREAAKKFAEQLAVQAQTAADLEQSLQADDLQAAAQQVQQTTTDLENAMLRRARLEEEQIDLQNQLIAGTVSVREFGRKVGTLGQQIEEIDVDGLTKQYDTQIEVLGEYGFTLEEVEQLLEDNTDAEKEHALALIAGAEATRQRFLQEKALLEQSSEQLTDRLQAIENERQATQLAVDELNASSLSTEEMTNKLEQYNDTLQKLGNEQAFINSQALETVRIREMEAEQQDRLKEAAEDKLKQEEELAEETEKSLKERIKLEKDFADDLVAISEKAAEDSAAALDKLNQKLSDLNRTLERDIANQQLKANRKTLEAQVKAQRAESDEFIKHRRSLSDIQQDADEQETDLEQKRNFQGVFNLRRSTRTRIQTEQRELSRRLEDSAKERGRARSDRLLQFQDARDDRLRKFRQDINDTNQQFAQERILAQQNAIAAIMIRRQQFGQEQQDLFQQGGALLNLRRMFLSAELSLLQGAVTTASGLLSQLQNQQVQSFGTGPGGSIAAFGAGALGTGNRQSTTTNNVNGNFTVNASPTQSAMEIAKSTAGALKGMIA